MKIDDDNKEPIKIEFPKRGQYFYASRCDGVRDYSYIDDVFKCEGSDSTMVVAKCLTDLRTEQFRLNRNNYTFLPVSDEVLTAIGVYPSPDDDVKVGNK